VAYCDQTAWGCALLEHVICQAVTNDFNPLDTCIIHMLLAYLSDVLDELNGRTTSLHGGDNILPLRDKIVFTQV
jgi:hypothetical protein